MTNVPDGSGEPLVSTGAAAALQGYFYQLDVSILIALELVMSRQVASSVVLEPIESKEDLELDIEDEPQLLAENAELEGYQLTIQCKLRNTGPWKVQDLSRLLVHGKRRQSAAARLVQGNVRYLLVTNADLDGVVRSLHVAEPGGWPSPTQMPHDLAAVLPEKAAGRIAVMSTLDREKVTTRVKDHLSGRFHVPYAHFEGCFEELRKEALLRMLGAADGRWTREEIDRVIVKFGGFAGAAETLEGFVRPKNWDELRGILATHHAIILTGPSGTGKTRTAQALIASLREEMKGVAVCEVKGAPEKIEQEKRRPVVFNIEDPWGRFERDEEATAWNDSVHPLLQSAGPDRKFVITSRSDIYLECGPKAGVRGRLIARLEPQHYGRAERTRLFRYQLLRLHPRLQRQVVAHWRDTLPELETPLEIERYFTALVDGMQEGEHEQEYFRRCLQQAHQESIENSILRSVRHHDAFRWAAVLWSLFKANPTQSFSELPRIQRGLNERDLAFEDGLTPFVVFLVAGHNLRQSGEHVGYRHPRVELGLQQAMKDRPGLSTRVVLSTMSTLIDLGKGGQLEWGLEGAVRLVAAARRLEELTISVSPGEQAALDQWIYARLSSPGLEFQDDLRLAKSVGSLNCSAAEVARWLTHRSESEFVGLDVTWRPPSVTREWVAWIKADPATATICGAFIRRLLARDHGFHREDFAHKVLELAPGLASAFRDAAMENADYGYTANAAAIACGALSDLDAFEPILGACLDHLTRLRAREFDDEWIALKDGHYDDEATEHYEQSLGEEGHTAGEFVSAYVSARRQRTGWVALRNHPRRRDLLSAWIWAARKDARADDAEWTALADIARHTDCEGEFWDEAKSRWSHGPAELARARLAEGGGQDAGRIALAELFAQRLTTETAVIIGQRLLLGTRSVLELACDLESAASALMYDTENALQNRAAIAAAIARVAESVPSPLDEAVRIQTASSGCSPSEAAQAIWRAVDARGDRRLRLARVRVLMTCGDDMSIELEDLLKPIRDSQAEIDFAVAVVEVAIRCGVWHVVEVALGHRFAAVRLAAMDALSRKSSGALPPVVLKRAADKSHRVRGALLELLKARRHVEHIKALLTLAADKWTPDFHLEGGRKRCPNAECAAEILAHAPALDDAQCVRILGIALEHESEGVSAALFTALICNGTTESRKAVLTTALQSESLAARRLAAQALVSEEQHLESALIAEVTDAQILKAPARTAFALTTLIAMRGDTDQAMTVGKAIAAVPDRQLLLVPLYVALTQRGMDASKSLLRFLPIDFASALEQAAQGGPKLPRDTMAPLNGNTVVGEILIEEALNRLSIFEDANT